MNSKCPFSEDTGHSLRQRDHRLPAIKKKRDFLTESNVTIIDPTMKCVGGFLKPRGT